MNAGTTPTSNCVVYPIGVIGSDGKLAVSRGDIETGYTTLFAEALPAVSASTQIFANAPEGTAQVWLTIRTAGLTIRTDGSAATAGANGHDFSSDGSTPYVFSLNRAAALLVKAIQNGGTATGWIAYRG